MSKLLRNNCDNNAVRPLAGAPRAFLLIGHIRGNTAPAVTNKGTNLGDTLGGTLQMNNGPWGPGDGRTKWPACRSSRGVLLINFTSLAIVRGTGLQLFWGFPAKDRKIGKIASKNFACGVVQGSLFLRIINIITYPTTKSIQKI